MINFFVTRPDSTCIRDYLQDRGRSLAERVAIHEYEGLDRLTGLPAAATIFAGMDRATAAALDAAVEVHDQLLQAVPASALLNHPRKALGRFDLLTKLYAAGCNRFTAIRARGDPGTLRFPVFIRRENDHAGSLTALLHDRRAVDRALWEVRLRGFPLDDLLIVEFCDTRDENGLFRKYSAMRIGDVIIPRYLHVSDDWVTKDDTAHLDEALIREELRYLEDHSHERWLRDVFDLAQIQYGRIDYAMHRGEPQVWEINTNPLLAPQPGRAGPPNEMRRKLRAPGRALTHQRMLAAFRNLDTFEGPPPPRLRRGLAEALCAKADTRQVPIVIPPAVRDRVRAENVRLAGKATSWMRSRLKRYPRTKQLTKRMIRTAAAAAGPVLARIRPHWADQP